MGVGSLIIGSMILCIAVVVSSIMNTAISIAGSCATSVVIIVIIVFVAILILTTVVIVAISTVLNFVIIILFGTADVVRFRV